MKENLTLVKAMQVCTLSPGLVFPKWWLHMKWEDCQGFENSRSEDYILLQACAFEREIIKYHGHSLSLSLPLYKYMNIPISCSILFFSSPNLSEQILAQFVILVVRTSSSPSFPKLQSSIVCLYLVKGHLLTNSKCPPIHCHPLEPNSCSYIFIICHEHAPQSALCFHVI